MYGILRVFRGARSKLLLLDFVAECLKTCMEGYYISAACGPDRNTVCKRK